MSELITGLQLLEDFRVATRTLRKAKKLSELAAETAVRITGVEASMCWIRRMGSNRNENFTGTCGLEIPLLDTQESSPKFMDALLGIEGENQHTNLPGKDLGLGTETRLACVEGVTSHHTAQTQCWVGVLGVDDAPELSLQCTMLLRILSQYTLLSFHSMDIVQQEDGSGYSYRKLVEELPAVIYSRAAINKPGESGFLSPQIRTILGCEPSALLGNRQGFIERLHPEDRARVLEEQTTFLPGELTTIKTVTYRMLHEDGHVVWILNHLRTVRDKDGNPESVLGILIDVTETEERALQHETHAAEEEVLRRTAESESEAKGRFLASMSHEIRTPMNAILGYAQLLQRESGLTPQQREYLETIDRSGEHLLALLNDVLDMAKIESGQTSITIREVDFSKMLLDIERMFRLQASEKAIELRLTRDDNMPMTICTDVGKVRQVLINLISNAMKFTTEGSIKMHVSPGTRNDEKLQVLIRVEDTGCGIEPEKTEEIFGAFRQANAGTLLPGTGLGLAVSRQFARLLGGDLKATSRLGVGSVFHFDFEAETIDSSTETSHPHKQVICLAPASTVPNVLVVDDVANNRTVLTQLLRTVGFGVRAAESGQEALKSIATEMPDLMLLDLRMPGMDGIEVTQRVRMMKEAQSLPIVIVSASAIEAEKAQVLKVGADAFIRKPVREDELFALIAQLTDVSYLYAGQEPSPEPDAPGFTLDRASVRALLPEELVDGLAAAVQGGQIDTIHKLVTQVEEIDPQTANALRELTENFEYEQLLSLLSG